MEKIYLSDFESTLFQHHSFGLFFGLSGKDG